MDNKTQNIEFREARVSVLATKGFVPLCDQDILLPPQFDPRILSKKQECQGVQTSFPESSEPCLALAKVFSFSNTVSDPKLEGQIGPTQKSWQIERHIGTFPS